MTTKLEIYKIDNDERKLRNTGSRLYTCEDAELRKIREKYGE